METVNGDSTSGENGTTLSVENMAPTQYLVMEVLAARVRLGESLWTFPRNCRPALRALAARGWVQHKSGIVEATERAWLTDADIRAWALNKPYYPPVDEFLHLLAGTDPNGFPVIEAVIEACSESGGLAPERGKGTDHG